MKQVAKINEAVFTQKIVPDVVESRAEPNPKLDPSLGGSAIFAHVGGVLELG